MSVPLSKHNHHHSVKGTKATPYLKVLVTHLFFRRPLALCVHTRLKMVDQEKKRDSFNVPPLLSFFGETFFNEYLL